MLDFNDIQGNILRGYRSFQDARFLYFRIDAGRHAAGRRFLADLIDRGHVTPADWGHRRPKAAAHVGLSMAGLRALDLNSETLASFPAEFQEGMRKRARHLGDIGDSDPVNWDEPWRSSEVHLLLMCYSDAAARLNEHCRELRRLKPDGVDELLPDQEAATLTVDGARQRIEHFGFLDGVSNPDIDGVSDHGEGTDTGNVSKAGDFRKVPVGEFLLGHRGEGGEVAPMPRPPLLVHNGSYLVLRKLEQRVAAFREFLAKQAELVSRVLGNTLPSGVSPDDYLAAKMMGRWRDGSPLALYPDGPAGPGHQSEAFSFVDDPDGARCPLGAHVRRANPRDALKFAGQIVSRRRMIRRGIAYGAYLPATAAAGGPGGGAGGNAGRGIMFLAYNASIERQFEFTQRQWLNFGDEFEQGDDSDPIVGTRLADGRMVVPGTPYSRETRATGRMVIPGDARTGRPPFLCTGIPNFVTTKGGDYFFVPSLTGLRLLAVGDVRVS